MPTRSLHLTGSNLTAWQASSDGMQAAPITTCICYRLIAFGLSYSGSRCRPLTYAYRLFHSICRLYEAYCLNKKNCNESQSDEVNGVGSIPVWSGGMDFEEIGQKQNRSF